MNTSAISMFSSAGSSNVHTVGDILQVEMQVRQADEGSCLLRTNLAGNANLAGESSGWVETDRWVDLPMQRNGTGIWTCKVPLTQPGWFQAKAYFQDSTGTRHWPEGDNINLSVHPNSWRSGNTIYCAFPRMFGASRLQGSARDKLRDGIHAAHDAAGWTAIPPSGTLRDFAAQVPHIVERLGCRIIHLLPINPTPTTHARYGRFGSPYAATDFTAIDPALIEHDRVTTGLDQFKELVDTIHQHHARLIIDLAINHTGWNSTLQNEHPEWFAHDEAGHFVSPGAWGTVWEDLTELDHSHGELWDHLADVFLTWCKRGVSGFRCDAGYMVPLPAWRRITARVREQFPETLFLLEGLGGGWDDTANLLGPGGMQWAYSELFQNYDGNEVGPYLDHAIKACATTGLMVHYSETHDNNRLAAYDDDPVIAKRWSLLRNRLCALTSVAGGFGFTCGVEWLAHEKLEVHQSRGLRWDADDHIIDELAQLNAILCEHPAFQDGAQLRRISEQNSTVYMLLRSDANGEHAVVCIVNLDVHHEHAATIPAEVRALLGNTVYNLCADSDTESIDLPEHGALQLPAGAAWALSSNPLSQNRTGSEHRRTLAQASALLQAAAVVLPLQHVGPYAVDELAALFANNAVASVGALHAVDTAVSSVNLAKAIADAANAGRWPKATEWTTAMHNRCTVIPEGQWLVIRHPAPFRYRYTHADTTRYGHSTVSADGHIALVAPPPVGTAEIAIELPQQTLCGSVLVHPHASMIRTPAPDEGLFLLTNDRGGMARLAVNFGHVFSKYDAALAANLHPSWPVDRHVLAKRIRLYVDAEGHVSPLTSAALRSCSGDHRSAEWLFRVSAGAGRHVDITLRCWMPQGRNELHLACERQAGDTAIQATLIARIDIEDRSFHSETERNEASEQHFRTHTHNGEHGFTFKPADDRQLQVSISDGSYHAGEEWGSCAHPVEATRGQRDHGDCWSPGWFQAPLRLGSTIRLGLSAETELKLEGDIPQAAAAPDLIDRLRQAVDAYLVQREDGRTVIAGYPWFLDWGRDTLICARGYLAAGYEAEVLDLLRIFGRFEQQGTLPNIIHGENVGNRDTVDAPLWFAVVAEELAASQGDSIFETSLGDGRVLKQAIEGIALGYWSGTNNGIKVDHNSALVWSPSHFTWMDTNYPAGTPRTGYPVEIQALWLRLARLCDRLQLAAPNNENWASIAQRCEQSLHDYFWLEQDGWFADVLIADRDTPAANAVKDQSLRSNALMLVGLDLCTGQRAQRLVRACERHLVVPGAIRSLAPLPVTPGLHIQSDDGTLLADPQFPYSGRYEGDEDTQRKPAYHNGTAWTWPFPGFCEAIVKAWPQDPAARHAAQCYLNSVGELLETGCRGHLPEIIDGSAPHQQRGCDAQAWGATEALRVGLWLQQQ